MTRQSTTETKQEKGPGRSLTRRQQETPSRLESSRAAASPFGLMRRLMDDIDQMFSDFGFGANGLPRLQSDDVTRATWLPNIEVFQRDDNLVVRAELPGLKKDDVQIYLNDGQLVLEGERRWEHDETKGDMYRSERRYGRFYRSVPVPAGIDPNSINAKMDGGVLEVSVKLPEEPRGRRIEIQEGRGEAEVH